MKLDPIANIKGHEWPARKAPDVSHHRHAQEAERVVSSNCGQGCYSQGEGFGVVESSKQYDLYMPVSARLLNLKRWLTRQNRDTILWGGWMIKIKLSPQRGGQPALRADRQVASEKRICKLRCEGNLIIFADLLTRADRAFVIHPFAFERAF